MSRDARAGRIAACHASLGEARRAWTSGDAAAAWDALRRAHVLGQQDFRRHLQVHALMLQLAWRQRRWRELRGQLLRLALVPLGHASGRLPWGNPGTSDVSAFAPRPVAPELQRWLGPRR